MFANYYLKDSLEINWVILVSLHKRLALGLFNSYSQFKMVLKKYDDVRVLCSKDQIKYRVYDAVNYGVRYYVHSNKVAGFYVSKPSYLETLVGINWIQCE